MRTNNSCWKLSVAWLLFTLRFVAIGYEKPRNSYINYNYSLKPGPKPPNTTVEPGVCVDHGEVELRLSRICMRSVGANVVKSKKVVKLHLDDNGITELSSCAFDMVPNLRLLNLSLNNISTPLMLRIGELKELKQLIIDHNKRRDEKYSALEEFLDCLPRLEELSLRSGGISRFAVNLKEFAPVLVRLNLSGNKIESVGFLKNAPENLKIVDLSDNALSNIEKGILNKVQELSVTGNTIEELCGDSCGSSSFSVRGMIRLETLNASRNAIAKIAANAFDDSSSLRILDLSANKIDNLDQVLQNGLARLEELFAAKNHLTTIPNVCHLNRLRILDLAGNLIEAVTKDSFCPRTVLLNIETVNLAANKIKTVDDNPFNSLVALSALDLSSNQITEIPKNLINRAIRLRRLSMKSNLIDNLENLSGQMSRVLQELHLQGNPLLVLNVTWIDQRNLSELVIYLQDKVCKEEKPMTEDSDSDFDSDSDSDSDSESEETSNGGCY